LANEDRRGECVRVAVQADDFSLGRRGRGQVGLRIMAFLGRCLELIGFCYGFFPAARLRLRQPARAADWDWSTDGRLQSGIRGLAPHDGAFRQGSITDWSR